MRKHSEDNVRPLAQPSNDDEVMFDENDNTIALLGLAIDRAPATGIKDYANFAQDDINGPLRLNDHSRKGKRTRSFSLNGEERKKPVSSLISKVSGGMS